MPSISIPTSRVSEFILFNLTATSFERFRITSPPKLHHSIIIFFIFNFFPFPFILDLTEFPSDPKHAFTRFDHSTNLRCENFDPNVFRIPNSLSAEQKSRTSSLALIPTRFQFQTYRWSCRKPLRLGSF